MSAGGPLKRGSARRAGRFLVAGLLAGQFEPHKPFLSCRALSCPVLCPVLFYCIIKPQQLATAQQPPNNQPTGPVPPVPLPPRRPVYVAYLSLSAAAVVGCYLLYHVGRRRAA